jgi:hypothetical protein
VYTNSHGVPRIGIIFAFVIGACLMGLFIKYNARDIGISRNTMREIDVQTIISAIHQYYIDNGSYIYNQIPVAEIEICKSDAKSCKGFLDLSMLTKDKKYLEQIPVDPQAGLYNGSGYAVLRSPESGRILVFSLYAEEGASISAKI